MSHISTLHNITMAREPKYILASQNDYDVSSRTLHVYTDEIIMQTGRSALSTFKYVL